jgi:8-amino-7-oxononanoate synthase
VLGAIDAALDLLPEMAEERARVLAGARRMRTRWHEAGLDTGGSDSQIVPVVLGEESRAMEVAKRLEDQGLLAVAIRPPTVPAGSSRIRVALTAAHTDEEADRMAAAMIEAAR